MASLTQKFLAVLGAAAMLTTASPIFAEPKGQERGDSDDTIVFVPVTKNTQVECLAVADNVMLHKGPEYKALIENHKRCVARHGGKDRGLNFNSVVVTCDGPDGVRTRFCSYGNNGAIACSTSSVNQQAPKMK